MSIADVYADAKKDKKDVTDKVLYGKHGNEMRGDIETTSLTVSQLQNDVQKLKMSLTDLETLDMKGFVEKHTRMKQSYNDLCAAHNLSQSELRAVIVDMTKRINDIEARLSL